jgi:hypothetical protein
MTTNDAKQMTTNAPSLAPVEISGMQQMMRFFAHGSSQKFFVKLGDVWIFVRFSDGFVLIFGINGTLPFF